MSELVKNKAPDVQRLCDELLKLPQFEPETNHYYANGLYARTIFCPAGVTIVGKVHKTEHFYCVLTGIVHVTTDEGIKKIDATERPHILVCKPGTQRAVYVEQDSWRMNVHLNPDNITDLEELESQLVEPCEKSPFLPGNKLKVEVIK